MRVVLDYGQLHFPLLCNSVLNGAPQHKEGKCYFVGLNFPAWFSSWPYLDLFFWRPKIISISHWRWNVNQQLFAATVRCLSPSLHQQVGEGKERTSKWSKLWMEITAFKITGAWKNGSHLLKICCCCSYLISLLYLNKHVVNKSFAWISLTGIGPGCLYISTVCMVDAAW